MQSGSKDYFEDFHEIFNLCNGHWKTSILRAVVSFGFIDIIEAKSTETKTSVVASEVLSIRRHLFCDSLSMPRLLPYARLTRILHIECCGLRRHLVY